MISDLSFGLPPFGRVPGFEIPNSNFLCGFWLLQTLPIAATGPPSRAAQARRAGKAAPTETTLGGHRGPPYLRSKAGAYIKFFTLCSMPHALCPLLYALCLLTSVL